MSGQDRNCFHYRMSKKVAELSQVVHMLFTRNHELEVEMKAMKDSYEYEIDNVIQDAKRRIIDLENSITELRRQTLQSEEKAQSEMNIALIEKEAEREADWLNKIKEKEKSLQEEKSECLKLRNLLQNAQKEAQSQQEKFEHQIEKKNDEIEDKNEKMELIKNRLKDLENLFNSKHTDQQTTINELQRTNEKLLSDSIKLQEQLYWCSKNYEDLKTKNQQLEIDMKELRTKYKKTQTKTADVKSRNQKPTDTIEEIHKLKQEVQRYRLELSNRDNNFTKMFCEKQPALIFNRNLEPQQKGQLSGDVAPEHFRNLSPNGNSKTGSSTGRERPSLLVRIDNQRRLSKRLSEDYGVSANDFDNTESGLEKLHYEQILHDYTARPRKPLLTIKNSIHNQQESIFKPTNSSCSKLPFISTSLESSKPIKDTTPTKSLPFVE